MAASVLPDPCRVAAAADGLPPVPSPAHRRLSDLLERVERHSVRALREAEVTELGRLYRVTLADLGERETRGGDPESVHALHRLAARAYAVVYRRDPPGFREMIAFLAFGFPALLRARIHAFLTALLIFLTAASIGLFSARLDAKLVDLVVPPELKKPVAERLARRDIAFDEAGRALLSSRLMTHNLEVAFRAFAGGIAFGLGTIHTLVVNGLMLGGLASVAHEAGRGTEFHALVLPHGALEFPAILIAAAGGFVLGFALIAPGGYRRTEWFLREGRDAAALLSGAVPLFLFAALIEAWVTPAPIPDGGKLLFAAFVFAAFCAWIALAGRKGTRGDAPPATENL